MLGGILSVLREFKVGKVIIGKQGEECEQYKEFCEIVKDRKISVVVVKKGDIINIEKDIQVKILFPDNDLISENMLNNNSLVMRFEYKDFKILFTGDIEAIAEEALLKLYSQGELSANILKVPHHGSKSSSTQKFLEAVNADVALIGVGKSNKFGHPNDAVLERFETEGVQIYRTDQMGEIILKYNCIKLTILVNNKSEGL